VVCFLVLLQVFISVELNGKQGKEVSERRYYRCKVDLSLLSTKALYTIQCLAGIISWIIKPEIFVR
jgi:hypothetical protein